MKRFLIAGTASGVGKTTITLALAAAYSRRGLTVQPFKCGPDYLDTAHHTSVCHRLCRNLDSVMLSPLENARTLNRGARGAELLIAEGMMGLFDGVSGSSEQGSSAEIAKMLGMPVVLVLDASHCSRSIAATVLGFSSFDPDLPLAGVILNRVAGEAHYRMLADAIESTLPIPVLGWFPCNAEWTIPERHLGLHEAREQAWSADQVEALADAAEQHINLDRLLEAANAAPLPVAGEAEMPRTSPAEGSPVRIGIARDAAFSFYYEDNLELLRDEGAELIEFSPITDASLPAGLDALYFGGGYPELHAAELSANHDMIEELRRFCASGRPVYAECGGMMYLARTILCDGTAHAMAGVLPLEIEMSKSLVKFGYVEATFTRSCALGPAGTSAVGHSFHYSRISAEPEAQTAYALRSLRSGKTEQEGYCTANVLGSYVHLHFRSNRSLASNFVSSARRVRSNKGS
jgi:cobyrinic acid a,c-diamide synthase